MTPRDQVQPAADDADHADYADHDAPDGADPAPSLAPGDPAPTAPSALDQAERAADLRLARLHLCLGIITLARAELEAATLARPLDGPALLDLAEARWRTGDLAAAGLAAEAWLAGGGQGLLGSLIAVEAAMADGRPSDARQHLDVLAVPAPESLDAAFNGMPRSAVWPPDAGPRPSIGGASPIDEGFGKVEAGRPAARPAPAMDPVAQLEAARTALDGGDAHGAAVRLSVALRVAPHLAPAVLELLDRVTGPMLDLVRGDAYRLVGRETEAERAWRSAAAEAASQPAPQIRRAGEPGGEAPSVARTADARPASAGRESEPRPLAPEPEEIP